MPSRVTRSSARIAAADSCSTTSDERSITAPLAPPPSSRAAPSTRKRKATQPETPSTDEIPSLRRTKRHKPSEPEHSTPLPPGQPNSRARCGKKSVAAAAAPAMSSGYDDGENTRRHSSTRRRQPSPPGTSTDTSPSGLTAPLPSTRRRSSRKKSGQPSTPPVQSATSAKKHRNGLSRKDHDFSTPAKPSQNLDDNHEQNDDLAMDDDEEEERQRVTEQKGETEEQSAREADRLDMDDPFAASLFRGAGPGLSQTIRALSGIMSGMTGRLRGILENLRAKEDPSMQLIALGELSEILLVSNEDNLAGHFSPDAIVKELVVLMQPSDFGEENPEMMLLACRCIANLMEAVPAATASVVYGGAVPVLCQKLLEIHFIDLAEQALSTLEKISVEFPSSIVREGGLTACLTYLDFFATSTQRTAVTTAANCCRNIPEDSFPVVRDVMPILLNVLAGSDQRVVEQGSLCVCRIVESFRWQDNKLEELVSPDLLRAITRLLLPGTTNMIGLSTHTQFLRVLAIVARASPRLSIELLRNNVVDTLYQILTGVSPPSGVDDVATKIDKNVIMQALIRTPKDQIFETLNVICELLPPVRDSLMYLDDLDDAGYTGSGSASMAQQSRDTPTDKHASLLAECPVEVRRFAVVLFPTLMHAYTSTVNLHVRQKVMTAQLKMLSNLDIAVVQDALRDVPYASHLASIISQHENPMLVTFALQISELMLKRLGDIYKPQFYREGVMAEISKLSSRPLAIPSESGKSQHVPADLIALGDGGDSHATSEVKDAAGYVAEDEAAEDDGAADQDRTGHQDEDEIDIEDDEVDVDEDDEMDEGASESGFRHHVGLSDQNVDRIITERARLFIETYGSSEQGDSANQATKAIQELKDLVRKLHKCYSGKDMSEGPELFQRLSGHFSGDALQGITSHELLTSGLVDALLEIFSSGAAQTNVHARADFLAAFMSHSKSDVSADRADASTTAFGVLVQKLQDLLSRNEHFSVITVHANVFESNRSSAASMLAKQLRLKLAADDDSGIPKPYRSIMVSIHAIATFRALDDYLRSRISLVERPRRAARTDLPVGSTLSGTPAVTSGHAESTAPALSGADEAAPSPGPKADASLDPAVSKAEPSGQLRRSSRKLATPKSTGQATPQPARPQSSHEGQSPLECADEAQLSDEDDSVETGIDTVLDEIEDELDEEEEETSAVNMEVANGGKVTARKEDGTRVSTPSQAVQESAMSKLSASARLAAARQLLSSPSAMGRTMSYASALQTVPQDWHIEFSVNGQRITNDTTIYRAVHLSHADSEDIQSRLVWSTTHKITFKRVAGPPPAETSSPTLPAETQALGDTGLPPSLSQHPQTAKILKLMSALHNMNDNLDDVVPQTSPTTKTSTELQAGFINTKLTAKLNRQLEEPLIVASNCLPSWSEDLARLYPFLFPFETRHLFLQSTSFGYSRSMARWQSGQAESDARRHREERPFLGRTQRQKVRISRTKILESALKVMEIYGNSPSILEVEYFEEVGTGLGPTLEFYSTVSREFSKKKLKLWRENESEADSEYVFAKRGLFPMPISQRQLDTESGQKYLHVFKMLGKFVARSMLDSRMIDIPFNPTFFRVGDSRAGVSPSLGAVASVDQGLAKSLQDLMHVVRTKQAIDEDTRLSSAEKVIAYKQVDMKGVSIEDLGLDFTLPGYPSIELEPNGASIDVTVDNVERYIEKVVEVTLATGVRRQVDAFREGFSQVFPYSALQSFTPDELVMLFGQAEEDWSLETLMDSIKADHGFNLDSASVRNLLHTMSEYTATERRDFLQFASGSPKLPIGGFKALTPMFTVVCKPAEPPLTSDEYLPSVMTCVNYLKLPNYSSLEVLRSKLAVAIKEGQGAFHLS